MDEVPEEGAKRCVINGRPVAVVRDADGAFHAIDDICSHDEISLSEGEVDGCTIECWLHGSVFDLTTGAPLSPPAITPVAVFPVQQQGTDLLVDVDTTINN
ncbi:non-heme iron oxygenase ferredoxin subunit [Saxibacter everestensis]|uniref:Non-heme iron oxygenase ferredoxin subunit n=1 Tax=Saxibacter everestensis TaxID=2909229 RepID=A0ABY8QYF6_9MICO|nr:non-heme iron oxygenase ferredoxin subunit [Brevibacteriaceae bacterium ZFBP1038]